MTPIKAKPKFTEDKDDEIVDPTMFRQLIGSLRCLYQIRPDIYFLY